MSREEKARKAVVAAHKAAGTYTPVRLVRHAVSDVICQQARIPRDRKTLFFQSSGSLDARTTKRKPSAEPHQFAPPDQRTKTSAALGVASIEDATKTL